MTKLDMWKQQIDWEIEETKKQMSEAKRRMFENLTEDDYNIAQFAEQYAKQFSEAYRKQRQLLDTLHKIEILQLS